MLERTERDTAVAPPPRFTKAEVQALRAKLRVSQGVFARLVGVSPQLEKAWELGTRTPSGPAARVLEVIAERPQAFRYLLAPKPTRSPRPASGRAGGAGLPAPTKRRVRAQ
jgi:DNA-binding transcriptional regulator YiaG